MVPQRKDREVADMREHSSVQHGELQNCKLEVEKLALQLDFERRDMTKVRSAANCLTSHCLKHLTASSTSLPQAPHCLTSSPLADSPLVASLPHYLTAHRLSLQGSSGTPSTLYYSACRLLGTQVGAEMERKCAEHSQQLAAMQGGLSQERVSTSASALALPLPLP